MLLVLVPVIVIVNCMHVHVFMLFPQFVVVVFGCYVYKFMSKLCMTIVQLVLTEHYTSLPPPPQPSCNDLDFSLLKNKKQQLYLGSSHTEISDIIQTLYNWFLSSCLDFLFLSEGVG